MIVDRHIDPGGLKAGVLALTLPFMFGPYKAAASGAVFTKQTFASTINATSAVGTQPDFPRNLIYFMDVTNGSASSAMVSGGTLAVFGSLINGQGATETIAFTRLAQNAGTTVGGTVLFASLASDGISFSNFSLATASSSASNSVSLSIGVGNIVALPHAVYTSVASMVVPQMWEGTSKFTNYTVQTGPVGTAGISVGPTLGSGSILGGYVILRAGQFGQIGNQGSGV